MDKSTVFATSAAQVTGETVVWGDDSYHRVVPADPNMRNEITSGVSGIAAGVNHSMVLKNGRVMVWGQEEYGQTAVPAEAQAGVTSIAAGNFHCLALKGDKPIGWGWPDVTPDQIPVSAQHDVAALASGYTHSLPATHPTMLDLWRAIRRRWIGRRQGRRRRRRW